MKGRFDDNINYYDDINILLYPSTGNIKCHYVLCAHNLSYVRENEKLEQKMPLGLLCKLGEENNLYGLQHLMLKKITATKGSLLVTVQKDEYFFEAICEYLVQAGDFGQYLKPFGQVSFLSHKYSQEEMAIYLNEALQNINRIKSCEIDIVNIERLKNNDEIDEANNPPKDPPQKIKYEDNRFDSYPLIKTCNVLPTWAENTSKDLKCDIVIRGKEVSFEILFEDFLPHYTGDGDGGWYVYTHEEKVVGIMLFPTFFSIQDYLINISKIKQLNFETNRKDYFIKGKFPFERNEEMIKILKSKIPFEIKIRFGFKCSIRELFTLLEIRNFKTICKTGQSNYNKVEKDWIYGICTSDKLWTPIYRPPLNDPPF